MMMCSSKEPYGGKFEESENLKKNSLFYNFLKKPLGIA